MVEISESGKTARQKHILHLLKCARQALAPEMTTLEYYEALKEYETRHLNRVDATTQSGVGDDGSPWPQTQCPAAPPELRQNPVSDVNGIAHSPLGPHVDSQHLARLCSRSSSSVTVSTGRRSSLLRTVMWARR